MIAMIAIGTGIGMWLDEKFETETPWWTLGLSLFAVFAALFTTLREHIGK
jgi:F0F1-type ATP synthase assembly protein I